MIIAVLAVLGLCFGSFVNALVWRIHEKKDWVSERSQCVHCGHVLAAADLIPVLSWLTLRGRCRYCKKSISPQYPLVELSLAAVYVLSYVYWPYSLHSGLDKIYFATWLASSIGLMALLIYDLRWMLLPNKFIYPTLAVAVTGHLVFLALSGNKTVFLVNWAASVAVASGIFFVLHLVSDGRWVGFGDVRLGLITGTLLHSAAVSFLMIFLASILGTLFVLPSLLSGKRGIGTRLPFGPFLIISTAICVLFGQSLLDWYLNLVSI